MNLTALIITFLRPEYTKTCVRSLRAMYPAIKIIVAENGKFDDDMRLFCDQNDTEYHQMPFDSGVCYARNRLVELAKTDYVLVGDDDFYYTANAQVERMLKFMESSDFDVIGGRVEENNILRNYQGFIDLNKGFFHYHKLDVENVQYEFEKKSGLRFTPADITFNFFVARRETLLKVQWDEKIKVAYEHSDWFIMLKRAGGKVAFSPDPVVIHKPNIGFSPSKEYMAFRNRKCDKERFFEKHKLTYVIDMSGKKDFNDHSEEIQKIDFLITHFMRRDCLERLLFSIAEYYPEAQITIGDQSKKFEVPYYRDLWERLKKAGIRRKPSALRLPYDCGLSYARNFLVQNTTREYKLILEDDFIFTSNTRLEKFLRLLDGRRDIGVVGGAVKQNGSELHFEHNFERKGDVLRHVAVKDWQESGYMKYQEVDCVLNFFLARSGVFVDVMWDDEIKISGEHHDFFLRLKKSGWKCAYLPEVEIEHKAEYPGEYKGLRSRKEFMAKMMAKNGLSRITYLNGFTYELKDNKLITYTHYASDKRNPSQA